MPNPISASRNVGELRAQVAQLRRDLTLTTEAYKHAVAAHDSSESIPLLRTRSRLMRELLEAQCQLLLELRGELSVSGLAPGSGESLLPPQELRGAAEDGVFAKRA
jgi:hypothetical protein